LTTGTKNCLILGEKRLIAAIGMEDCLIVDTADATLIAKRGSSQNVKEIIAKLEKNNRKEAVEHTCTFRPWGSYTVLEEGGRYKIKRIVVNTNSKLSLQKHKHRSEHWVVIKGTAKVTIGEKELIIHENESAYIPKSVIHRLENPGEMSLEIIEIQNGEYLGGDDIERFDDLYGR
jgi:mannose-1-phosphate guanylyltransferase/mannose-6-phosphate isomerase